MAGPDPLVIGQIMNFVFLYFFWQFARYRLWRYRLSRTSWRGIRFFLTGSGFKYALHVLLWTVATIVSLGWAYPWLQAFRLNYQLNNTQFGDTWFTYQGTAKGLFRYIGRQFLLPRPFSVYRGSTCIQSKLSSFPRKQHRF